MDELNYLSNFLLPKVYQLKLYLVGFPVFWFAFLSRKTILDTKNSAQGGSLLLYIHCTVAF